MIGWDRDYPSAGKEQAIRWLDAFHRHYDVHRAEIFAAWQERERQKPILEKAALERERQTREEEQRIPPQIQIISVEGPKSKALVK